MSVKVAFVQETFVIGGREKVVATMIEALNEMGIVPDICTLENRISKEDLKETFDIDIQYRVKQLPNLVPNIISGSTSFYINLLMNFYASRYSLIINLTSSMAFCRSRIPTCFYITVPRSHVVLQRIAQNSENNNLFQGLRKKIHTALVRKFDVPKKDFLIFCLGRHTQQAFEKLYPGARAEILYPPVDLQGFSKRREKKNQIVNLGRYSIHKRQLELIKLAPRLKDFQLLFAGPGEQSDYYRQCSDYVKRYRLNNVKLLPVVALEKLKEILAESMFYVHMFPKEPFGMATVEAIAAGCIPIVPDSWGNKETVCISELRYSKEQEIVEIIRNLVGQAERIESYRQELSEDVRKYARENFKTQFRRSVVCFSPALASSPG